MAWKKTLVFLGISLLPYTAIAQGPEANGPATRGDLEAFAMRIEGRIEQFQKDYDARLKALEDTVKTLSEVQQSGQQALNQIAKTDKDGKSYLQIDTSHEPTREVLKDAIAAVSPKAGRVVIHNKTNANQWVAVDDLTILVLAQTKSEPISVQKRHFVVRTSNNRALHWGFEYPKTIAHVNIVYNSPMAASSSVPAYLASQ